MTPSLMPQMVLDVNANTFPSNPSGLTAVGSTTYFTADDGLNGVELWKSDGTAAGTVLVKNIYPGSAGSEPAWLTNVNGTLYFVADDGASGRELWKSDGTSAGTVRVKDIYPGSPGSSPYSLTNVNGTLFFVGYDDVHGSELWKSDGSAAGTVLVKDINPSWGSSSPRNLTNVNGTLFFSTWDYYGTITPGLWKCDGTAAGTTLVKNLYETYPGQDGLQPRYFTAVNGTLFFQAYDQPTGWELWKSNGTAAGTGVVKDIYAGGGSSWPSQLTNSNGTLFFRACDYDGNTGYELWKSDGTAAGTVIVKNVYPGAGSGYPANLTNVDATLFFTAADSNGGGLWKSDGTAAGTVLVSASSGSSTNLTNVNGTLFFTSSGGTTGFELWKSNGTAAGTVLVKDIYPGGNSYPHNLTNAGGTLMFAADDGRHGVEMWKSDGTAAGTTLVKDIRTSTSSSYPKSTTAVNGTLYFAATDGVNGEELWKTDGTAAGTILVKDINPGGHAGYYGGFYPNSSSPTNLTNVNGTLFFTANDGTGGWKLWKSDGTAAGTVPVGSSIWYPSNLTAVGDTLYFTADDGYSGTELWACDGTAAGTTLVKDIYPAGGWVYYGGYYGGWWQYVLNSSSPGGLTNRNGTLFFSATDEAHGRELWTSDGTAAGTVLVKDVTPGVNSIGPTEITNVNGTLFFRTTDGVTGRELWKSDGTAAGTTLVKDIRPGSTGSYASYFTNVNGTVFFSANDGTAGYELWKSDGTAAGTVLVKDIRPGSGNSYPGDEFIAPGARAVVNGILFFHANDGVHGRELWKSDGTAAGTVLVKDIYPGVGNNYTGPFHLTSVNGTLFFVVSDGTIWQSNGTEAGTQVVANLYANLSSTLMSFNDTLFFTADDGTHGRELWKLVDDGTQSTSLAVNGFPVTVTAGATGSFTVTANYADGTMNTNYRGTVHFTSTDPQAALPADYTFTATDNGGHSFTATLKTAGSRSITVSDTVVPGAAGTQAGITINPAAASRFTVAGFPSPVTAGVAGTLTVTAWDAYGNRAIGYTGTVRFTSGDVQAALPGNYTFTAADAGTHAFGATLKTAGYQSLTATDIAAGGLTGAQGDIQVTAAAASRLVLVAPASVQANASFSLTFTVVDAYGNVVTGYRGTLSFSSSDATASLPKKYTFTAADQGVHTFTNLRLRKKGQQTITVTDKLDSSLTGSVIFQVL